MLVLVFVVGVVVVVVVVVVLLFVHVFFTVGLCVLSAFICCMVAFIWQCLAYFGVFLHCFVCDSDSIEL